MARPNQLWSERRKNGGPNRAVSWVTAHPNRFSDPHSFGHPVLRLATAVMSYAAVVVAMLAPLR
jgi:hypothetical protein